MPPKAYSRLQARAHQAVTNAVRFGGLTPPASCDQCQRIGKVHAHHSDYAKPLEVEWLCAECHAAVHKIIPDWVVAAQQLRAAGESYSAIARLLGKSQSAIYRRLNPDKTRERSARDNAKRREYKRAHERERVRSLERRGKCNRCGGPMGVGVRHDGVCLGCRSRMAGVNGAEAERARLAEKWWNEGVKMQEIADRLSLTKGSLSGFLDRWRASGFDFPYRYAGKKNGTKFEHLKKAA